MNYTKKSINRIPEIVISLDIHAGNIKDSFCSVAEFYHFDAVSSLQKEFS